MQGTARLSGRIGASCRAGFCIPIKFWAWRGNSSQSSLEEPLLGLLGAGDTVLQALCWGGAAAALLLTVGVAQAPMLALSWLLYLSLVVAGQEFLSFQWDILLLETGFLAIFFAPGQLLPRLSAP